MSARGKGARKRSRPARFRANSPPTRQSRQESQTVNTQIMLDDSQNSVANASNNSTPPSQQGETLDQPSFSAEQAKFLVPLMQAALAVAQGSKLCPPQVNNDNNCTIPNTPHNVNDVHSNTVVTGVNQSFHNGHATNSNAHHITNVNSFDQPAQSCLSGLHANAATNANVGNRYALAQPDQRMSMGLGHTPPRPREFIDLHINPTVKEHIYDKTKAIDMVDIYKDDPRFPKKVEKESDKSDNKKEKIQLTKDEWMQAFCIYSFALLRKEPQLAQGLFAHMSQVLAIMKAGGDWSTYDISVRRLIASESGGSWGDKFQDEKFEALRATDRAPSGARQNQGVANKGRFKPAFVPSGFCIDYHRENRCSEKTCPKGYLHTCYKCEAVGTMATHRAMSCNQRGAGKQTFQFGQSFLKNKK